MWLWLSIYVSISALRYLIGTHAHQSSLSLQGTTLVLYPTPLKSLPVSSYGCLLKCVALLQSQSNQTDPILLLLLLVSLIIITGFVVLAEKILSTNLPVPIESILHIPSVVSLDRGKAIVLYSWSILTFALDLVGKQKPRYRQG